MVGSHSISPQRMALPRMERNTAQAFCAAPSLGMPAIHSSIR